MSGPVTNVEIEDVLSSIRRLVSDEARASEGKDLDALKPSLYTPQVSDNEYKNAAEGRVADVQETARSAPALVLTPALRIQPDDAQPSNEARQEQGEELVESPAEEESARQFDAPSDHEAAQSGDSNGDVEDQVDEAHEPAEIESQAETAPADGPSDNENNGDEKNAERESTTPLEDAVAEFIGGVDAREQGVAIEDGETPAFEALVAERDADEQTEQPDPNAGAAAGALDFANGTQPIDEALSIEDKIAALEAIISGTEPDFELDGSEEGDNAARAGRSLPWPEAVDTPQTVQKSGLPDPEQETQTASFEDAKPSFEDAHADLVEAAKAEIEESATAIALHVSDTAAVMDEDALRELVSEIVREQLQGPLGERITRNVRKLVRREIYRAMASNELD